MTATLRTLITRVYREVNITGTGRRVPKAEEAEDAVDAFNALWRSMQGRIIGQRLKRDWDASAGETLRAGDLVNVDCRTPCQPKNGDRIGVIGARTVTATDGTIEGSASVTSAANVTTTWFYREDLGDWKKETVTLGLDDLHPFCDEVEESLPFMLALRMCGQFGHEVTPLISAGDQEGQSQFRQIYGSKPIVRVDHALLRGVGHHRHGF